MNDQPSLPPRATVKSSIDRRRRISLIWAIPAVTALVGLWLVWQTLSERGPEITISFDSASGITAGQSHVRHKDVDMGLVTKVALSPDLQHVIVTVRMNAEATPLLTDKAWFWVVKPRFFAGAFTGLQTLVSGSYIELQPSTEGGGQPEREFVGLEEPPVLQSSVPGHTYLLRAPRIGSLSLGSPVFFRDEDVGQVLGWDLSDMADRVIIHAFVRAPYDKYVHDDTRFWNASGASVRLGADGVQVELESWRALILGGIAFETPEDAREAPAAGENHVFPLYANKDAADAASYTQRVPLLTVFRGSVSGLGRGSAVTTHGIKIGEVNSVGLRYDPALDDVVVRVRFEVEPERIAGNEIALRNGLEAKMRELLQRGLRAHVETSNLITGQKQLAVELAPEARPADLSKDGDAYVVPALNDGSGDISMEASNLLSRLNSIPFEQIGSSLKDAAVGLNARVNDPNLVAAMNSLQQTLSSTQELVQRLNTGTEPLLQRMPAIARDLESAVRRLDSLTASLQSGYGGDSRFARDASRLVVQLSDAAQSIRVLADLLARHPEALIRGRPDVGSP